ncbi:MAG: WD40/YVTN/BNR-like repeat-containing protein [Candidatus Rokuibacteriota bacterium]
MSTLHQLVVTTITVLAVLLTLAPAPAAAQPGRDAFEHVHALAFDAGARALWLGTHTGLFRSEDQGRTWARVALPVQHHAPDVMAIAAHPAEPDVLYIGTHETGALKTTDGGKTWRPVNAGLGGLDVHGLAMDPKSPTKLHALVRDKGAGVYRTTDGGQKWVRVDDGPAGETKVLASVNIPTGMGGIFLYAGTAEGLQRSPDCF